MENMFKNHSLKKNIDKYWFVANLGGRQGNQPAENTTSADLTMMSDIVSIVVVFTASVISQKAHYSQLSKLKSAYI